MDDASEVDKWTKVVSQTRADELRNEAVDAGQDMASHTEDSDENNGKK